MSRLGPMWLAFLFAAGGGCHRATTQGSAAKDAAPEAASVVSAARDSGARSTTAPMLLSPAVFSTPIAGIRVNRELVVAGLVVGDSVVRVMALRDGEIAWAVDVLKGATWIADAELRLQPAADGVALFWRGDVAGRTGSTLVVLGPHGEPRGEAVAIGAAACTTADGIASLDAHAGEETHVRARRWTDPALRDVVSIPSERATTLSCGDHAMYVLGDGDDDLTATAFAAGDVSEPPMVAIRDKDFGDDDEREHHAYSVGDDLGVVRVGDSGAIALREISHGHASAWRRLKHALSEDDDVVAVDGDGIATFVVFTREASDPCLGTDANPDSVRTLRVDRQTGEESSILLAPAHCDSAPGPFWIALGSGDPVVAWTERRTKSAPNAAPIDALAYRVIHNVHGDAGGLLSAGRIELQADAVVDASCDDTGCFAAALLRTPETAGDRPGPIRGLRYP
jgi:hypothetical protein